MPYIKILFFTNGILIYRCMKVINKYVQPMYEQILVYKNFKKLPVCLVYIPFSKTSIILFIKVANFVDKSYFKRAHY